MTKDKGRGLFASIDIQEGELILVEKAICYAEANKIKEGYCEQGSEVVFDIGNYRLECQCQEFAKLKGIQALRLSYLYYGDDEIFEIPPISVFVENTYKQHKIADLSPERIN